MYIVFFHYTKEGCKVIKLIKTDLWFGKRIWKIFTGALESLKIGTLAGSFYLN